MRVLIILPLLLATLTSPTSAAAESYGCTLVDENTHPVEITEPISCTFPCPGGDIVLSAQLHSSAGAIKASCGSGGFAVAFIPACLAAGPLPENDLCTHDFEYTNYRPQDLGRCLITPDEGINAPVPMLVYTAHCYANAA